jgi:hypothetical protein
MLFSSATPQRSQTHHCYVILSQYCSCEHYRHHEVIALLTEHTLRLSRSCTALVFCVTQRLTGMRQTMITLTDALYNTSELDSLGLTEEAKIITPLCDG